MVIPEFKNELDPNPVTHIDIHTRDGTTLRFNLFNTQQSRFMLALGGMLGRLGVELDITLPEVNKK